MQKRISIADLVGKEDVFFFEGGTWQVLYVTRECFCNFLFLYTVALGKTSLMERIADGAIAERRMPWWLNRGISQNDVLSKETYLTMLM